MTFAANDLLQPESGSVDINFDSIIGCSATVRIGLPEGKDIGRYPDPAYVTFFNGIVADISFEQSGSYRCTIRFDFIDNG